MFKSIAFLSSFLCFLPRVSAQIKSIDPSQEFFRLNHIQVLGTHNSYKQKIKPELLNYLKSLNKEWAMTLEYSHPPLNDQLQSLKIRQLEIDVYQDTQGGQGFKVLHIPNLDFETSCSTLKNCLEVIRDWSDKNPRHLPLMILLELKDQLFQIPGLVSGVPWMLEAPLAPEVPEIYDGRSLDLLDSLLVSVIKREKILTPDDVRRGANSLREAILQKGWPTLEEVKGKILFFLDNENEIRNLYLKNHPTLEGRVIFTPAINEDSPEAAFFKVNDPEKENFQRIQRLVKKGFIVRTRADSGLVEGRKGDTRRRDTALQSGAQLISTDFPKKNIEFGTDYLVEIPGGGIGRCNPVSLPNFEDCQLSEEPFH